MHFEILIEDQSGKKALDIIVPKIIDNEHTFRIIPYKGIGRIPKGLRSKSEAKKRILLDQLPRLLRGYGNTFSKYGKDYQATVIVVCDLDDKCLREFKQELNDVLFNCNPKPETRFCLAVEEGESWFLGDLNAIRNAYPGVVSSVLSNYKNDSICGTWELLADAVYPGGARALSVKGWQAVGAEKSVWAEKISPHMNIVVNKSPSFCYFRNKLQEFSRVTD
ncbi:MAG: hypothetical protein KAR20_01570 [Candidatus Heimdallarchaeota archaeon]|nr:hypothetical protein [Candidatus Heimdallarchaeota archaeon]